MFSTLKGKVATALASTTLIDVTEFLNNPVRGGVQRCTFELLRRWPDSRCLPFFLSQDGSISIAEPNLVDAIDEYFTEDEGFQRTYCLAFGLPCNPPLSHSENLKSALFNLNRYRDFPLAKLAQSEFMELSGAVVNVELFFDPRRIEFYERYLQRFPGKVFIFNHDFLPFLNPDVDPNLDFGITPSLMSYVHLLRKVHNLGFNSEATKRDFINRISRAGNDAYPVFRPGSDGLGPRQPNSAVPPGRPNFVVLGAIEHRKRSIVVLRAINRLIERGCDVSATFVGKMVRLSRAEEKEFLDAVERSGRIEWIDNVSDRRLAGIICGARATIFASPQEGYGIPPLESLSLGVPVIISADLPSFEGMPGIGYARCADDEASFSGAIEDLLADDAAHKMRHQIKELPLPTWSEFATGIAEWVHRSEVLALPATSEGSRNEIAPLWKPLKVLQDFNAAIKLGIEDALHAFYGVCLRRPPSGAEFNFWYTLGKRENVQPRILLLGLLAAHRSEIESELSIDPDMLVEMIRCALDPTSHYSDWIGLPLPFVEARALRNRLWRVAQAIELDNEGFVEIGSQSLMGPGAGAETVSRWKREAQHQPFGAVFATMLERANFAALSDDARAVELYRLWCSLLISLVEAAEADIGAMLQWCYRTLLGRDPDTQGLLFYAGKMSPTENRWKQIALFVFSDEARHRPRDSDARLLIAGAVEAGSRRTEAIAPLVRRLQSSLHYDDEEFARSVHWTLTGSWSRGPKVVLPADASRGSSGSERLRWMDDQLSNIDLARNPLSERAVRRARAWIRTIGQLEYGLLEGNSELLAAALAMLGFPGDSRSLIDEGAVAWHEMHRFADARLLDETLEDPGLFLKILEISRVPNAEVSKVFALCRDLIGFFHIRADDGIEWCADRPTRRRLSLGSLEALRNSASAGRRLDEIILGFCVQSRFLPESHALELTHTVEEWVAIGNLGRSLDDPDLKKTVFQIYRCLLGRDPDEAGLNLYQSTPFYDDRTLIIQAILESEEFWRQSTETYKAVMAASVISFRTEAGIGRQSHPSQSGGGKFWELLSGAVSGHRD